MNLSKKLYWIFYVFLLISNNVVLATSFKVDQKEMYQLKQDLESFFFTAEEEATTIVASGIYTNYSNEDEDYDTGSNNQEMDNIVSDIRFKGCGNLDMCRGRNSERMQPPLYKNMDKLDSSLMCYCDQDCTKYGDCCIDNSLLENPNKIDNHQFSHLGCIPISETMGVIGIKGCNGSMSDLCSKSNGANIESDISVYSKMTGTVFANVYCALCHGVSPDDIVFANVTSICGKNVTYDELQNMDYNNLVFQDKEAKKCISRPGVKRKCPGTKCSVTLSGLPTESRFCRIMNDECQSDSVYKLACDAYTLPVYHNKTRVVYKNPHCALCHGATIESLHCYKDAKEKTLSLAVILDFDFDFTSCHLPFNVWDSRTKRCQPIDCHHGVCVFEEQSFEGYMTAIVLIISIVLLLVHNSIYYMDIKRQNVPSRILKTLSWCLIFGHSSFLIIDLKHSVPPFVCKTVAFSVQFFYLASFFWMNVMSFDVWRTFSQVTIRGSSNSIMRKYNFYCWGCSSLIILLTIISDLTTILPDNLRPHLGLYNICWFSNKLAIAIYFFTPIFILLLINLFLFGKTVMWFQKQTAKEFERVNNEATGRKDYLKIWLYIKLSVIMGLTWLCCIISSLTNNIIARYVFICFNGLQGAFIFIMFDMKKRVFNHVFNSIKSHTNSTINSTDVKQLTSTDVKHLGSKKPLDLI